MIKQDIILFSTADWDTPYWTNKQHMAKEFASLGHRVLYIESVGLRKPKISSGTDWKRIFFRLFRGLRVSRNVDSNIWALSPLVLPFAHGNNWVIAINQFMMTLQIKIFARKKGINNPLIWTYHPYILNIIDNLKYNNRLIYHCVDDLSAVPGIDKGLFKCAEKKLLKRADIVFVTSKFLEKMCKKYNKNTFYFPNVVDYKHFSGAHNKTNIPDDVKGIPKPRIVYMGALSEFKIDFDLLDRLIQEMPEYNFVFIGDEIEGQKNRIIKKISSYSNAFFLGFKKYKVLPEYLSCMQVALLPMMNNLYTKSMSPMKLNEYIAAGLPVAVTPINFMDDYKALKVIRVFRTTIEFKKVVNEFKLYGRVSKKKAKEIIQQNTWRARTLKMLKIISNNL